MVPGREQFEGKVFMSLAGEVLYKYFSMNVVHGYCEDVPAQFFGHFRASAGCSSFGDFQELGKCQYLHETDPENEDRMTGHDSCHECEDHENGVLCTHEKVVIEQRGHARGSVYSRQ
jgi:hypothetical protein